jgi:hypothetical protein
VAAHGGGVHHSIKDMVAVRLTGALEVMAVASPKYFARHGRPQTPRDLRRHHCINMRTAGLDPLS